MPMLFTKGFDIDYWKSEMEAGKVARSGGGEPNNQRSSAPIVSGHFDVLR